MLTKHNPPTTVEECADIALAEFRYWRAQKSDLSIVAMGAAANIYVAITTGNMAPWHINPPEGTTPTEG